MIRILSIHIPKTAGTSFYRVLQANYPGTISESLRREHIQEMHDKDQSLDVYLGPRVEVVHGHVMVSEAMDVIDKDHPRLIAFFRDPVERVISNYCYFQDLLHNPDQQQQNPEVYEINKHRVHESIYEYAEMEENRNVMWQFIQPLRLDDFYFTGLMEHYREDVERLGQMLQWQHRDIQQLNVKNYLRKQYIKVTQDVRFFLKKMNEKDEALYEEVVRRQGN